MRKPFTLVFMGMPVVVGGLVALSIQGGPAGATPPSGVQSTPLAQGRFAEISSNVKTGDWKAQIRTKGLSDVYVLENRLSPGATFGWHSHPGPSFVIVKSGVLSVYHGEDPSCAATKVPAGHGFLDEGGSVHEVRNETASPVVVVVTSVVPAGADRREDQPASAHCTS